MARKDTLNSLLDNIDPELDLNFYGIDLNDEKAFQLFIKKCEFLCRKSQEYDMWQRRTKALAVNQNPDEDKNDSEFCPICEISYEFAAAESHHHPITLFNLCVKQFQDWIDDQELADKRPLDLVQEVMEKHLCEEVEHIILCKHCHEKYHNGEINIKGKLQKILDYKRSQKLDSYPQTLKEMLELKRKATEQLWKKRKDDQKEIFQDLHDGISTEDIMGSILSQIGEREFYEELNKNKDK